MGTVDMTTVKEADVAAQAASEQVDVEVLVDLEAVDAVAAKADLVVAMMMVPM